MGKADRGPVAVRLTRDVRRAIALIAVACVFAVDGLGTAHAHTTSTGLAELTVAGTTLTYRLTLVLSELPDSPAQMLAAAVENVESAQRAADVARAKVTVRADGALCSPARTRFQGSRLGDGRVTLEIAFQCPGMPARLVIRDDWFDLFGEHYRTLARLEGPGGVREAALLPDARETSMELGASTPPSGGGFFRLGVEHILTGYDHLLFLAALLLGSGSVLGLFKIVTAFTLAHSITLAIAVLGLAAIPARVVEPLIAASIVWVAIENVWLGRAPSRRWLVSFGLGPRAAGAPTVEPGDGRGGLQSRRRGRAGGRDHSDVAARPVDEPVAVASPRHPGAFPRARARRPGVVRSAAPGRLRC